MESRSLWKVSRGSPTRLTRWSNHFESLSGLIGSPFSMAFAEGQLTLTNCSTYLQYATQASQCSFTAR
jgi:hypothetical protein